ncbi:hypothetical protein [Bacillus mycoides]|uniref:hypothetical protein n=1 Tax=Bacillus mycoides TaxID=1405 RepID=UPI001C00E948|nr:hypothetical protein [Bacillus mycoides]QWI46715.1 hypothetical protein EXW55_28705 [Bacillus mycoides]
MENRNVLSVRIDVDTQEAKESIEELILVVNECTASFEKLEKAMGKFTNQSETADVYCGGKLIGRSEVKQTQDSIKMSVTDIKGVRTNEIK